MNNILCMAVSKILDNSNVEYNKELSKDNIYKIYRAMSELVIHSAESFIQEDFEIVTFNDEVNSYQEIFHKNFSHVHEVWKNDGPNNVLFLDCDTLVISPVEIFGKFDHFQLFNYTDPKKLSGKDAKNKYGLMYQDYFNAGVRYYPKSMTKEIWELGWKYAQDWDYDIWGTEQLIFNEMMYSQNKDVKFWLNPEMNYQAFNVPYDNIDNPNLLRHLNNWNGIDINQAKILHLHGTRGAANTLLTQWEIWRRVSGEEFEFTDFSVKKEDDKAVGLVLK